MEPDYRYQLLHEILRVLDNGGCFINGDKIAMDNRREYRSRYNAFLERVRQVYSDKPAYRKSWLEHLRADNRIRMVESVHRAELARIGFWDPVFQDRIDLDIVVTAWKR